MAPRSAARSTSSTPRPRTSYSAPSAAPASASTSAAASPRGTASAPAPSTASTWTSSTTGSSTASTRSAPLGTCPARSTAEARRLEARLVSCLGRPPCVTLSLLAWLDSLVSANTPMMRRLRNRDPVPHVAWKRDNPAAALRAWRRLRTAVTPDEPRTYPVRRYRHGGFSQCLGGENERRTEYVQVQRVAVLDLER